MSLSMQPGIKFYDLRKMKLSVYIGPNDHTVVDFWRMVCEQNVSVIVMVTNCIEEGKVSTTIQYSSF